MEIHMIVAVAENGVIAHNGEMPWRMPSDLRYFKQITLGKPVIMGRKTWETLPTALPGRLNIVISGSRKPKQEDNIHIVPTGEAALVCAQASGAEVAMIIGGGEIYTFYEAQAQRIYLTRIHAEPEGDVSFHLSAPHLWTETQRHFHKAEQGDSHDCSFIILERK